MSFIDGNRHAPFGAITIFRLTSVLSDAAGALRAAAARRGSEVTTLSPAHLEDIGLSVADMPADRRPGVLAGLAAWLAEWNARRRTVAELDRLSDAQLEDIGLTRGHVEELRLGRPLI